jgi:aspartyl-tRNA(Asn)/glutamyl-tRNA(Gln) amidotransferase subunit A
MTRCVDDAAWLMQVLAQPDPRDATSLPAQEIDWHAPLESPKGLRIGLMLDAGCGMPVDARIAAAVEGAAARFSKAGAVIVPVTPVLNRKLLDGIDLYWRARLWGEIGAMPDDRRTKILPYILEWAEKGALVTGVAAIAGFNATFELRRLCATLFDDVDVVLSPTTPNVSFPAEWPSPLNDPQRPFEHICYTLPWNMSEQPAISLNCGFTSDGFPIGLQIITPRFSDWQALALARWYETLDGPHQNWPHHN